jgi:hypothetical protein
MMGGPKLISAAGGRAGARADLTVTVVERAKQVVDAAEFAISVATFSAGAVQAFKAGGKKLVQYLAADVAAIVVGEFVDAAVSKVAEKTGISEESLQLGMVALSIIMARRRAKKKPANFNQAPVEGGPQPDLAAPRRRADEPRIQPIRQVATPPKIAQRNKLEKFADTRPSMVGEAAASKPLVAPSTGGPAPRNILAGAPGSAEHKALRWQEYKARGGEWSYERWEKTYGLNMERATQAHEAVNKYHAQQGWGKREVTIDVEGVPRRLDIADVARQRGVEYKTGYQSRTQDNLWEITRDEALVKQGWTIEWVFQGKASGPLMNELTKAGIKYSFR